MFSVSDRKFNFRYASRRKTRAIPHAGVTPRHATRYHHDDRHNYDAPPTRPPTHPPTTTTTYPEGMKIFMYIVAWFSMYTREHKEPST